MVERFTRYQSIFDDISKRKTAVEYDAVTRLLNRSNLSTREGRLRLFLMASAFGANLSNYSPEQTGKFMQIAVADIENMRFQPIVNWLSGQTDHNATSQEDLQYIDPREL